MDVSEIKFSLPVLTNTSLTYGIQHLPALQQEGTWLISRSMFQQQLHLILAIPNVLGTLVSSN